MHRLQELRDPPINPIVYMRIFGHLLKLKRMLCGLKLGCEQCPAFDKLTRRCMVFKIKYELEDKNVPYKLSKEEQHQWNKDHFTE